MGILVAAILAMTQVTDPNNSVTEDGSKEGRYTAAKRTERWLASDLHIGTIKVEKI
jgi:hypothetical protein